MPNHADTSEEAEKIAADLVRQWTANGSNIHSLSLVIAKRIQALGLRGLNPSPTPSLSPEIVTRLCDALKPFSRLANEIDALRAENPDAPNPENWSKACEWKDLDEARAALNATLYPATIR